jgi:EamA domain-containing membrane protein RarD
MKMLIYCDILINTDIYIYIYVVEKTDVIESVKGYDVTYMLPWLRIAIILCIKRLRSNEIEVNCNNLL